MNECACEYNECMEEATVEDETALAYLCEKHSNMVENHTGYCTRDCQLGTKLNRMREVTGFFDIDTLVENYMTMKKDIEAAGEEIEYYKKLTQIIRNAETN